MNKTKIKKEECHERAKIFIEKNGEFDNLKYMLWISKCSTNYKRENKIDTIFDHDDFTEYLKTQDL